MTIIRKNHHYVESKEFGCHNNIGRSLPSFSTRSRRSKVGFIVPFVPTYSRYHEKQQQQGENKNFILQCENNDWNNNNNYYPSFQQKTEKFRSKWHTKFHMAGGIVYKKSVLSNIEFQTIQSELQQLSFTLKDEKSSSVAKLRKGAQLPYDSPIVQILADTNGSIYRIINDIAFSNHPTNQNNNHTMILSTFIPVELRVYEKVGAGMDWHVDDVLTSPEQMEVVLTLENTSDCVTMWKEQDKDVTAVETEANSAIFLKAGSVPHCVSSLKRGYRSILKFAYVRQNSQILDGSEKHTNQFLSNKQKHKHKR